METLLWVWHIAISLSHEGKWPLGPETNVIPAPRTYFEGYFRTLCSQDSDWSVDWFSDFLSLAQTFHFLPSIWVLRFYVSKVCLNKFINFVEICKTNLKKCWALTYISIIMGSWISFNLVFCQYVSELCWCFLSSVFLSNKYLLFFYSSLMWYCTRLKM